MKFFYFIYFLDIDYRLYMWFKLIYLTNLVGLKYKLKLIWEINKSNVNIKTEPSLKIDVNILVKWTKLEQLNTCLCSFTTWSFHDRFWKKLRRHNYVEINLHYTITLSLQNVLLASRSSCIWHFSIFN